MNKFEHDTKIKIGILTFHRPINYGAFLQSYSLCENFKKNINNSSVEIIDYIAPKEKKNIYLNILRTIKYYGIIDGIKEVFKIRKFHESIKFLNLSPKYFCSKKLKNIFKYINKRYDLLIIGSDAVFNWNQNGYPSIFLPQYCFDIPVFSYAASVHGLEYNDLSRRQIIDCSKVLSKMKIIGVRDLNTEIFIKTCNNELNPVHCCDPTVLLNFKELYSLQHRSTKEIEKKYKINLSKKYIVLMLENKEISKEIYDKYKNRYMVISLFKDNKYSDIYLYDLSPIEWSAIIKNSQFTFTNFFHGTLISLLQNVPAVVFSLSDYDNYYEGKLEDLMCRRLKLNDFYIKKKDWKKNKKNILKKVDYYLLNKNKFKVNFKKEKKTFDEFVLNVQKKI